MRYIARRRLHHRSVRRARLMLSVFKWRCRAQESITWRRATQHGDRALMLRIIRDWRVSIVEEMVDASDLAERGEVFFEHMLMKTYLRGWVKFIAPARAKAAVENGRVDKWWRRRRRETLFGLWKHNVRRINARRAKSIEVLLFMLPLEFENSTPQIQRGKRAIMFHRRHAQLKAWEVFVGLNAELADLRRRFKVWVGCRAWEDVSLGGENCCAS